MELRVIYEDDDILVVYKPAGVATQTSRLGQKDMESILKNYRAKKGEPPYIGVVHRLDQPVEGVMVFAKNEKATADINKQVQQRSIGKYYYALTTAIPESTSGTLTDYLTFNGRTNVATVVKPDAKDAKKAELSYQILAQNSKHALIDIALKTGRHHQIRIQMAHMGCALVGDGKYGNVEGTSNTRTSNLGLCSYRLQFIHPTSKKELDFTIEPEGKAFIEFDEFFKK